MNCTTCGICPPTLTKGRLTERLAREMIRLMDDAVLPTALA